MYTVTFAYSTCAILVFIWTQMRFADVSKPYRRQIKYYWVVALTYSAYYLLLFVILIILLALVSTRVIDLLGYVGLKDLKEFLKGSPQFIPPIVSAAVLYKAHDVRFFNQLEKFIVDRLLSAHHLEQDYNDLKRLLGQQDFTPSPDEFTKNLETIEEYAVFVSDPPTEPPDLHSGDPVTVWRKVSTLIRHCKSWLKIDTDAGLEARLDELDKEHKRRTGVALHLLRLKMAAESMQGLEQQIGPADMPEQAPDPDSSSPLIVTSDQLNETSKIFSEYFIEDYKKLMRSVSDIAAQLVIFSGSSARGRLEELKQAGFEGLGNFKDLTFHKVILVLISVFLGAFALFYVFFSFVREPEIGQMSNLALTTKIATVYAFSALCGALIGSSRRLMKVSETPWGWFFLAGLLGWCVWLTVTVLLDFNPDLELGGDAFALAVKDFIDSESLHRGLPWSFLPIVFAAGVAAIIRGNPLSRSTQPWKVKIADGAMLGCVLVPGLWVTFMIHHGLQTTDAGNGEANEGGLNMMLVIPASLLCFVFAFVVGVIVIDMARQVAQSGLEQEPEKTE